MLTPWWKAFPGHLEAELEALREAGLAFTMRDPDATGYVVIDVNVNVDGVATPLAARYPDVFPYMRPEVYAPDLSLEHHQNPFLKNLCLLGRRSDNWTPQMTLAQLILEQLPKAVTAAKGTSQDDIKEFEEHQGEPISAFYTYPINCICLLDGSWKIPAGSRGGSAKFAIQEETNALRTTVLSLTNEVGTTICSLPWADNAMASRFADARWTALDAPIVSNDPNEFDRQLCKFAPALLKRNWFHGLDLILVAYPEELGWRASGVGWVLLVRHQQNSKGSFKADKRYLVRVGRAGLDDLLARSPEARRLTTARVALFGLGCVGAPIALELARSGIQDLVLIDDDFVDAGATVRWPFGIAAAGRDKVSVLSGFIQANYPFTRVRVHKHRVGAIPVIEDTRDAVVLDEVLSSVDVVVDATAEFGVQRALSDLALQRGVPYIGVHGTHGGYGGEVMRLRKGKTGCWICLALHRRDGQIGNPPSKDAPWQQPEGCASPTFEGASWDLTEMSLAAVRMIIDTLAPEHSSSTWDVGMLTLRDETGKRIPPSWTTFAVSPHAECSPCAAR